MNKTLIAVIVVVLLAIATTVIFKREDAPPAQTPTQMKPKTTEIVAETESTTAPVEEMKSIAMTEVVTHNTEADCWEVIDGKVYDVTKAVEKHPGGEAILKGCGKDATAMFKGKPHSPKAEDMLKNFKLGELKK